MYVCMYVSTYLSVHVSIYLLMFDWCTPPSKCIDPNPHKYDQESIEISIVLLSTYIYIHIYTCVESRYVGVETSIGNGEYKHGVPKSCFVYKIQKTNKSTQRHARLRKRPHVTSLVLLIYIYIYIYHYDKFIYIYIYIYIILKCIRWLSYNSPLRHRISCR